MEKEKREKVMDTRKSEEGTQTYIGRVAVVQGQVDIELGDQMLCI